MTAPVALPSSVTRPSDEVIDALVSSIVSLTRRVEIYESDGVTPFAVDGWNSRLVGGSITVDRDRPERRMGEIHLENKDLALPLDPYDGFWYDKILKAYWGIRYYDGDGERQAWEMQVGEFMIDRINPRRFPKTVVVTVRDYAKKCLVSQLKASLSFPAGTPCEDIIRALAANCGVTKFLLPTTGRTFDSTVVFPRGTQRWNVMSQIADSIGYELYFRGDGYLAMRPYSDPTTSPVAWSYTSGQAQSSLIDYDKSSNDSRLKNHIIVVGATTTIDNFSSTVFAEAINDDPSSPTRVDRIGDRTDIIESDFFTTDEDAQLFADTRLAVAGLEEYEVNFSGLVLPWLEPSDIIDIEDGSNSDFIPRRFLLANYSLQLGLGAMDGVGRRVTVAGTPQNLEYA